MSYAHKRPHDIHYCNVLQGRTKYLPVNEKEQIIDESLGVCSELKNVMFDKIVSSLECC